MVPPRLSISSPGTPLAKRLYAGATLSLHPHLLLLLRTMQPTNASRKGRPAQAPLIKFIKNSSSAFKPFNVGLGGQKPASPGHALVKVLVSGGRLARAVDGSMDEVEEVIAKV